MIERTDSHRVKVTARAARDLNWLPEKIAAACVEFIFGHRATSYEQ